jgi:hypothetical protein
MENNTALKIEITQELREVLDVLQNRIDNPNATHYVTSDLKECWNTISNVIDKIEK